MIGEDERVGKHYVLLPPSSEDHHLGDVVWCERLASCVDCVGFRLVAIESNDGEFLRCMLGTVQ
jgi:hypothetical protein